MKRTWIQLATLSSALCIASASWADIISWGGGVGNWDVGSNWGGGNEPGAADTARINQNGAIVTVDSSGNQITSLEVALNGGSIRSSMLIDSGGAVTISGAGNNLWIAQQGNASPTGSLTVSGTLNYNGQVQMSTFQNAGTSPSSSLNIDGGTVFIDSNLQMTAGGHQPTPRQRSRSAMGAPSAG